MAPSAAGLPRGTREIAVQKVVDGRLGALEPDFVALEEPLDIQLGFGSDERQTRTLSITMRTPGYDRELAAGFLFAEGVVSERGQILALLQGRNSVRVELSSDVEVPWKRLERHVLTSSSCGVCGSTCISDLGERISTITSAGPMVGADVITSLPRTLRREQKLFDCTGGLHAAALFNLAGELQTVFEDVGRHNALDKLVGSRLLAGELPLTDRILLVSGRASFELVQKALAAGIAVLAAVGAPSSLAVDLAYEGGMTLAGFVRDGRFNVYSGRERITGVE